MIYILRLGLGLTKSFYVLFFLRAIDIGLPVGEIIYQGDKSFIGHSQRAYEPYGCSKFVEWGFSDNSVRLYLTETGKVGQRNLCGVFCLCLGWSVCS